MILDNVCGNGLIDHSMSSLYSIIMCMYSHSPYKCSAAAVVS